MCVRPFVTLDTHRPSTMHAFAEDPAYEPMTVTSTLPRPCELPDLTVTSECPVVFCPLTHTTSIGQAQNQRGEVLKRTAWTPVAAHDLHVQYWPCGARVLALTDLSRTGSQRWPSMWYPMNSLTQDIPPFLGSLLASCVRPSFHTCTPF